MPSRGKLDVTFAEAVRILSPYVSEKFMEQAWAILPIVIYLGAVQWLVLRQPVEGSSLIIPAILVTLLGLMFFMEGLRIGLMPLGEDLGSSLPVYCRMPTVLAFSFLVGMLATLAEPAIGTLRTAGASIPHEEAPLLAFLLGPGSGGLVVAVGVGVGIAALIGIFRLIRGYPLGPFIYPCVIAAGGLTLLAVADPDTRPLVGLAWDCGAVTTGPVTVPLVLALGIGVARATGRSDSGMAGFGIVTLASLMPVIMVLLLGFLTRFQGGYLEVPEVTVSSTREGFLEHPAVQPLALAVRAILPLVLFLYLFLRFVVRRRVARPAEVRVGVVAALVGMALFNLGLAYGLTPLGDQIGRALPASFSPPESALYGVALGVAVAVAVGFLMGYGATLAEPALNALGATVEEITVGCFRKKLLMHAVAAGVATGIGLGVAKFIFGLPIHWIIIGGYTVLLILTALSKETFINIGWDSAGVTTGPVTVPLVIAMGLGIGGAVGVTDGFGVLSLASIFPIMMVLGLGLTIGRKTKK